MSTSRSWFVPGRVEILGKHTDYAGGRSLLAAVCRGFRVTSLPRADSRLLVRDKARGTTIEGWLDPDLSIGTRGGANYAMTVARRLARNFPAARRGADVTLESDLPNSAGLSSSSAMIVAVFLALADANGLDHDPAASSIFESREAMAGYAAAIENGQAFGEHAGDRGVGTSGGSQDHTAILCCREGELAQYAFCPVRHERTVPLDDDWLFAIGVSGVHASKTGAARHAYNNAAAAIARILELWRETTGGAHTVLAQALASSEDAAEQMRGMLDRRGEHGLRQRLDQFIEESESLVPQASGALADGDFARFGIVVDRSQHLAEVALGNQVPETVALARLARENGAAAASAFGAGFGGSVWALVRREKTGEFLEGWISAYRQAFPDTATRSTFFTTPPAGGAAERISRF